MTFLLDFYRYFKGYVRVRISGDGAERFINICVSENISVWSILRIKDSIVLNLAAADYRKLLSLRHQYVGKIKIKLLEKRGLIFFIKGYRLRKGIPIGLLLFIFINILLSEFIWNIEVKGNTQIDSNEIILACKDIGINIGDYRRGIDTYDAKQKLAIRFEKIAWVSLNIEGSKLTVNLSEASENEKNVQNPRNIIASRDGVVRRIEIIKGMKNVAVNQAVRKGDVLVSGIVENPINIHFVSAEGEIIAETELSYTKEIPKQYELNIVSSSENTKRVFEFFWLKIPLYLSGVNYESESRINQNNIILLGEKLPIGITNRTFNRLEKQTIEIDKNAAKNIAISMVVDDLRMFEIEDIIKQNYEISEKEDAFVVKIDLVCLENICDYKDIN